jgi:hypothetical protein
VALLGMFALGRLASDFPAPVRLSFFMGAFLFAAWGLLQVPFWIASITFGWRLERSPERSARRFQFGLREVLVAIGALGLAMGILRIVIDPEWIFQLSDLNYLIFVLFWALSVLLTALPFFLQRWEWTLIGSVLFAGISVVLECLVAMSWGSKVITNELDELVVLFASLHCAEIFWTVALCSLMRRDGYRLVR